MIDLSQYPTYDKYRTLKLMSPMMKGADVYALQTALNEMGLETGGADGIFGSMTDSAVKAAQSYLGITVDGLAGGGTQTALTKRLANRARTLNNLPSGLVFGQCMHESSCRLGNYSDARADGSYDAGVAQRNTNFHSPQDAFDVEDSIELLGAHLRKYYDKYVGIKTERRRWELASGAWNAPAYASWIAKQEGATKVLGNETAKPGPTALAKLEEYMKSATAYLPL